MKASAVKSTLHTLAAAVVASGHVIDIALALFILFYSSTSSCKAQMFTGKEAYKPYYSHLCTHCDCAGLTMVLFCDVFKYITHRWLTNAAILTIYK